MAQTQLESKNTQYVTQTGRHTQVVLDTATYTAFDTNRKMAQTLREAHR